MGTRKNRHNFTVCQCKCNKLLFERIYGKGYVFSQREFTLLFVYIKNTFKNTDMSGIPTVALLVKVTSVMLADW